MQNYLYEDLYQLEEKHWWHISKRNAVNFFIRKYTTRKFLQILDIGCGTGKNMDDLQKFGKVYGLDNSPQALHFCRKRGLKNLKLGRAENTPFRANSFDLVTLLDVLEHTNDDKTLEEMQKIIRKDGLIIITVPAFTWLWSKWDEVLHHKRRYTKNTLINLLKKNGFKIIYSSYLYSFLVLPAIFIRTIKQLIFFQNPYPSDFQLSNVFLNKIIHLLTRIEFKIALKISIPLGTSILIVAKK